MIELDIGRPILSFSFFLSFFFFLKKLQVECWNLTEELMSSASVYRLAPLEKASESHGKEFQLFSTIPQRCYCKERDGCGVTGSVVSHNHWMSFGAFSVSWAYAAPSGRRWPAEGQGFTFHKTCHT